MWLLKYSMKFKNTCRWFVGLFLNADRKAVLYIRQLIWLMLWILIGQTPFSHAQLPVDPNVVHGDAVIDTVGTHMSITNSPNAIINWQGFSIGSNHSVHFQQQDAASQVLNRVAGNNPSEILGNLSSNGGVWLINPHGVIFGENARIDVGSLIASSLDISNLDFLANRYHFNAVENGSGSVFNQGEIRTSLGGRIWMIGEQVQNEGLIQSPQGNIVLAAGKSIELIDSGAPNVVVRVIAPENQAVNLGTMVTGNGQVDVHGSIVNQQGVIRAGSVTTDASGRIVLKAADTLTLAENSLTQADEVRMYADRLTHLGGEVDVSSSQGAGGNIQLNTNKLEGMASGVLRADGEQGGHIRIEGSESVVFSSTLSATGNAHGGQVEVTGGSVVLLNADVDASGGMQGGTVHLGGGWQGTGDLPHAREVMVGVGSEVKANGTENGGEIVVWSTQSSEHYGSLQARDGGRIELSSKGEILQGGDVQVGSGGTVLLDPKNLIITDNPPDNLTLARKIVSGSVDGKPELTSGDNFGSSIALDGDRLAIGASKEDGGGNDQGAVHLFTGMDTDSLGGLTWQKKLTSGLGAINMSELNDFDLFGVAVALDGDHLAVGVEGELIGKTNQGAVHLFSGVGTDFSGLTKRSEIQPESSSFDFFGTALALDGNRLVVGAPGDSTVGSNRGAVFLYTGIETNIDNPSRVGKIFSGSGATGMRELADTDFFGWSVALDGNRLAVGAFSDSSSGTDRGAVYLFDGVGTDFSGLAYQQKLISGAGAIGMPILADLDFFGWSLALDDNQLVVGAFRDDSNGNNRGSVHLFTDTGGDFSGLTWQRKIVSSSGANNMSLHKDGDGFGWSLALDGDRLAVGTHRDNGGDSAVYLFNGLSELDIGVTETTFAANASATSYITPTSLTRLLAAGTSVRLQASNDISVQSAINVEAGDVSGNFTLQAGRTISFDANVTTSNGDLTAVAGDSGANAGFRDPGTPTLRIANDVSLDVGSGTATLAAVNGDFINNNGNSAILNSENGRWLIYASDPATTTEGFSSTSNSKSFNQVFTLGNIPDIASSGNWFLYASSENLSPAKSQVTVDASVQHVNTAIADTKAYVDEVSRGRAIDMVTPRARDIGVDFAHASLYFGPHDLGRMSRDEQQQLIIFRKKFKEKLFAEAIHKLELDPSLADVPVCERLREIDDGTCRISEDQRDEYQAKNTQEPLNKAASKTSIVNIPQIERKYIVLFGVDQYSDQTIPPLLNAVFDAQSVGNMFSNHMGYEMRVVKNATRADLVRTLNQVSIKMEANDSVVIYYAGHGYMLEKTGHGYWIPGDASATDPESWISNKSVSQMLAGIDSKQVVVISDSCYSGAFASEAKFGPSENVNTPAEILARRSVVAMSSGGDEPVADEGRDGHSIFAWYLMQEIQDVDLWRAGSSLFKEIQAKVSQSFPQTPQYGGVISAGHEESGDYLFEFRQLEESR